MTNYEKRLIVYLKSLVNSVYKILPLYEESNVGLDIYIRSLLFELDGLDNVVPLENSDEYLALMSNLNSIMNEVVSVDSKKSVVKREVFKCINIIKSMVGKLEEGE